jgi:hypothetical protein
MIVILRAFAGGKSKRFRTPALFFEYMKKSLMLCLAVAFLIAGAGCASSPQSRIKDKQAAFNSYPAEVRAAIERGQVAVGFTPDQVRLALDEPDRVLSRTTEGGYSEVWIYREKNARFGLGLGVGMSNNSMGGGVGVSTGGREFPDERMRVIFTAGRVSAIEQVSK